MTLGSALPSPLFHAPNIGQDWFVAGDGDDTTGDGTEAHPWLTPQKALDYLRLTAVWPTNQDVRIRLSNGATFKAASAQSYTINAAFVSGARSPNASRWLIIEPEDPNGSEVIIENPDGTSAAKGAVRLQSTTGTKFLSLRHLHLTGGYTPKGSAGNGNSIGLYLEGNNNSDIEFIYGEIDGFYATPGSPSSAQAVQVAGSGTAGFKFCLNHVHDIGNGIGTTLNQEHGYYSHSVQGDMVLGNLFEDMVNGYDIQFFGVTNAGAKALIAGNTSVNAKCSGLVIDDSGGNVIIVNNVFADHTGRGSSSYGIEFYPPGSHGTGNVVDSNLYHGNTGGNHSLSPAGWTFTNELTDDPLFTGGGGYRPLEGSPLYAAGDEAYIPPVDLDGNERVAATIGAYVGAEELTGDTVGASSLLGAGVLAASAVGGIDVGDADLSGVGEMDATGLRDFIAETSVSSGRGFIDLPEFGEIARATVGQLAHTRRGQ